MKINRLASLDLLDPIEIVDEEEANAWLMNFLVRYNAMEHRSEPHSRMEDWLANLPASGV
jgi:hypothetical protein